MNGETANVLIIDSNISTSRTFKLILQKRGFQVVTAEDSAQALEKIKTTIFDAIVISLENPGPDGFDLLLFARKNLPNAARLVTIGVFLPRNQYQSVGVRGGRSFFKTRSTRRVCQRH